MFDSDTASRYLPVEEDPNFVMTRASTFGGPDDSQDNGRFAFGGGSTLPDGSINPEPYAAFPKRLYESGLVEPGGQYRVINPINGRAQVVVARDVGPSAPGRGLDVAPHVMAALGARTDDPLYVDFTNGAGGLQNYSDSYYNHQLQQSDAETQGDGFDTLSDDTSLSDLAPVNEQTLADQGVDRLTPIGNGQPETVLLPSALKGMPPEVLKALGDGDVKNLAMPKPKPVKKNDDGSTLFSDGVTAYPDGHVEFVRGDQKFSRESNGRVTPIKEKTPDEMATESAARKGVVPTDPKYNVDGVFNQDQYLKDRASALHPKGSLSTVPLPGSDIGTGEAALEGLPNGEKEMIRRIANYEVPISPRMLSSNSEWQSRIERAQMYDPTFDISQYQTRMGVRRDYTSGPTSKNMTSINTAIEHLGSLHDAGEKLNNTSFPLINTIKNSLASAGGDPDIVAFNTRRTAVADELAKAFKGAGADVAGIKEQMKNINSSQSPEQLNAAIAASVELLGGRLDALHDGYKKGVGKPLDFKILDDRSRKVLERIGAPLTEPTDTPDAPNPSATPASTEAVQDGKPDSTGKIVGKRYYNPNGSSAIYRGNGKWE